MKLQIVDFEIAKDLKELGFDWDCHYAKCSNSTDVNSAIDFTGEDKFTKEDISNAQENNYECFLLPEQSLVCKWLRDVHKIDVDVAWCGKGYKACIIKITPNSGLDILISGSKFNFYDTFEESELEGIKEVIKYLKDEMGKNTETS